MTPEEVVDFFAPSSETIVAVSEWITSAGISSDRISLSANKQVSKHLSSSSEVKTDIRAVDPI